MQQVNFPITSYDIQYQRVDDNDDDPKPITPPTSLTGVTQPLISRRRRQWIPVSLTRMPPVEQSYQLPRPRRKRQWCRRLDGVCGMSAN